MESLPAGVVNLCERFLFFSESARLSTLSRKMCEASHESASGVHEQVTLSNIRYRPSFNEDVRRALCRLDGARRIDVLDLRSCMALDDATLSEIAEVCGEQLRELYLDGTDAFRLANVTDRGIEAVCRHCSALRVLSVRRSYITDEVRCTV